MSLVALIADEVTAFGKALDRVALPSMVQKHRRLITGYANAKSLKSRRCWFVDESAACDTV